MKLERTRMEHVLGIVPTLPIWIMLAAAGFIAVFFLPTLTHCALGGSNALNAPPCTTALSAHVYAIIFLILGIFPVLYFWNVLLVKLGWDA